MRNQRITHKRAPGERPYAVIKNIFYSGHVKVTTTLRTHTKNIFTCFCYNLLQLNTLKQKKHNLANANKKTYEYKQK
jgi:IS5 family transposase